MDYKELDKLIDDWEDYVRSNDLALGSFGFKEMKEYQRLMVRTYTILDETIKSNLYNIKICNLFSKMSKFGIKGINDQYECTNTRLYEIASMFHYYFLFDFFEYDGFIYNEESKPIIIGIDLEEIIIDTNTFDFDNIEGIEELLGIR